MSDVVLTDLQQAILDIERMGLPRRDAMRLVTQRVGFFVGQVPPFGTALLWAPGEAESSRVDVDERKHALVESFDGEDVGDELAREHGTARADEGDLRHANS